MSCKVFSCLFLVSLCTPSLRAEEPPDEKVSKFAEDVLLHVILHEIGHGLVREFDIPVLGNEETVADAFATHYLTHSLPERAFDVLKARTDSLMIEANAVPKEKWTVKGEHNSDARRAFQIAALAVAADSQRYSPIARGLGMTDGEIRNAADYGSEIHRSWRRVLRSVTMPTGMESKEARVTFDPGCKLATQIRDGQLAKDVESALRRFDWHSQVGVFFVEGDGGAAWSRSQRSITVRSQYIRRFIRQGSLKEN